MRIQWLSAAIALLSTTLPSSLQDDSGGDKCAEIAKDWTKGKTFPADSALACLKSIPFHQEQAKDTLHQLRLYFQFFAAQAYYQNPPAFAEVAPVDTNKTFDYVDERIDSGYYKTNLDYDYELMNFFASYRHSSVEYITACSGAFLFGHDYPLFAVAPESSADSIAIHVVLDAYVSPSLGPEVDTINGHPVLDFLLDLINTLPELKYIDPDARWNALFYHRSNAGARPGAFAQRLKYDDSADSLAIKYKDGKEVSVEWTAEISDGIVEWDEEKLPWTDKDSFLNQVCLKIPGPEKCGVDVLKRDLKRKSPDTMWGYTTPELETQGQELCLFSYDSYSVLAISSFDPHPGNSQDAKAFVDGFQETLYQALKSIKDKDTSLGTKRKLLIDLSHNDGGRQILAHEAARLLLPAADHFYLVSRRWSPALHDLMTADFPADYSSALNYRYYQTEDGKDFASANDLLGPLYHDNDYFTKYMRPDQEKVMKELWGDKYVIPQENYWNPDDIVVVADGLCQSACAILLETLQSQGVKVAAYGGRQGKKMQGAGGLKGHTPARFTQLDEEIYTIFGDSAGNNNNLPQPLPIRLLWGSVGLENRFRKGETTPMEFVYNEASWTHKFTEEMFNKVQAVWDDAYSLAYGGGTDQKGGIGSTQISASTDIYSTAVDDIQNWKLGQYIWEFFGSFHPQELFDVKETLTEKQQEEMEDDTKEEDKGDEDGEDTPLQGVYKEHTVVHPPAESDNGEGESESEDDYYGEWRV